MMRRKNRVVVSVVLTAALVTGMAASADGKRGMQLYRRR